MKPKTIVWIVIAAVAVGVAIWGLRPQGGGIENVDAAGAQKAIESGAQVIDVRSEGEYQLGHIPGSINVPVDQLETAAQGWDRNETYLVYCATGARSATAVETMKSMGFGNIRHFNAGIQAWGGNLEQGDASTSGAKTQTSGKPVFIEFYTDS
jgi:rhodanese-related sulfurtransferase